MYESCLSGAKDTAKPQQQIIWVRRALGQKWQNVTTPGAGRGKDAIILFTKVPRPGLVKTRLIAAAGSPSPSEVSSLYVALLEDTLSAVKDLRTRKEVSLFVSFTPADGEDELRRIVGEYADDAEFLPQIGTTVTERVRNAFESVFKEGCEAVSLIPGDHADLDGGLLGRAYEALSQGRPSVVLGPTPDGGAFLLGFDRDSFERVRFELENTHLVCADIFRKAKAAGVRCSILESRNDIDDWEDAGRLLRRGDLSRTKTWVALRQFSIPADSWARRTKVSVIIPVLNEERVIAGVLDSLGKQTSREFEVIVVDGGSQDMTVESAWGKADEIVLVERPSRRGQENVAASEARGDALLFLHADMVVPPTLVSSVIESLSNPRVTGGSCRVIFRGTGPGTSFLSAVRLCGGRLLRIHGISSGFYVRRSAFERAGGFRDAVMEEAVDLQRRISSLGEFVTLSEVCTTSARRFNRRGRFFPTLVIWVTTVLLTALGLHFTSIEKKFWNSVR